MKAEQENFDQIQRMLKLKRYEQPPPRYFNDFSGKIVAKIRAGELDRHSAMESMAWEAPWLQRLLRTFSKRPGLSGSFAAAICAVFIGGVLYSEQTETAPAKLGMTAPADVLAPVMALNQTGDMAMLAGSSTNPIVQPGETLFDKIRLPAQPMPAAFQFGGN